MFRRHPSTAVLDGWLNGEGDADLDLHIGSCSRCAALLEELDATDGGPDSSLGESLALALAPPEGLSERLEEGIADRLSSREVLDVVADLFGAGLQSAALILTEGTDSR